MLTKRNVELIKSLNSNKSCERYAYLYCIAADYKDLFNDKHYFKYTTKRRLSDAMGYDWFNLKQGQKAYITRMVNLLIQADYLYIFSKKWFPTITIYDLK